MKPFSPVDRAGHSPHRPRKRFGQNFLNDAGVIDHIVSALNPQVGQRIVEIGPGLGALTIPLLRRLPELDVIELDRDLGARLRDELGARFPGLRVHQADALRFDYLGLLEEGQKLRIVGNLPYNISTPLLLKLLAISGHAQDMHFMLQKEVADRLAATPGHKQYGRLTVAVRAVAHVETLFAVGPSSFTPPPKVNSSVVRLTPLAKVDPIFRSDEFERVVRTAFTQRRKMLSNALKTLLASTIIENLGIDPDIRPERLTVEQFALLARGLQAVERGQP